MKANLLHNIGIVLTILIAIITGILMYADRVQSLSVISPAFAHYWPFCLAICTALLPILQYVQKQIDTIKLVTLFIISAFFFSLTGCAGFMGGAKSAGVVALSEAGKVLSDSAIAEIQNVTKQYAANGGVTEASLLSSAIFSVGASAVKDISVSKISSEYQTGAAASLVNAAQKAVGSSSGTPKQTANAIATVISTTLGAPPANPAKVIGA